MSTHEPEITFPQDFLWGAATSAHQVEGNTHNQWTVWELQNAAALAEQAKQSKTWLPSWNEWVKEQATKPENYVSAEATDHYNRYKQDFDALAKLNMNAFRFSIEWSRIEPTEGAWDPAEIDHYRSYLRALRARGIEPMMTLMHWTLPVWFTDKGGFEKRRNLKYFTRFAEKVLIELAGDVQYICTINEPEIYTSQSYYSGQWPPNKQNGLLALRTYANLAAAHNKVAKVARAHGRGFKVGLSKNCSHRYAGDDARLSRIAAGVMTWLADYAFLNRVKRNLDWLGLNFYSSDCYYGLHVKNPNQHVNDLGWDMQPWNIQFVIQRLHAKYQVPIIVTENGVADAKDEHRQWWLAHTIEAMSKAMASGAVLHGYLHWSLLDNFEWAEGKWARFGLLQIDYTNLKRRPRASALWFGRRIKQLRGL